MKFLNKKEKAEIERKLNEQFGIETIPGNLIKMGEERIFFYQGDLTENTIEELRQNVFIERAGVYFARDVDGFIRLSIEGSQILKDQITKNIFELNDELAEEWMKGHELPIATGKHCFLIMKHGEDFLGTGKASESKIGNFIPKNRRLREKRN